VSLLLDLEHRHHFQAFLLRRGIYIVLKDAAVMADGEQTELGLLVFIKTFTESDRSNLDFVCTTLAMELPFNGFGCVTL
jgi:hypothetical protein